ncbi:Aste57867_15858 [Aphanomyces stellatus]|uniref:Aste57867_15858 protein n=1 Tax=Aphanomyces stellatus TaxID=120398 RepID=A0A485L422_9STRA|nr:hypothetical protein As57867_015802 [Aphanomyces stellatus]VFT92645.1 Aste57867_15858 [Aphanomyces stellatus]
MLRPFQIYHWNVPWQLQTHDGCIDGLRQSKVRAALLEKNTFAEMNNLWPTRVHAAAAADDDDATRTVLAPKLTDRIRRRVHACRKADFLDVLHAHPPLLRKLPLSPHCDVNTAQAFRDAVREDIVLNGVRFVGDHRTEAFVAAVKRIVQKFVPKGAFLPVSDRVMRSCSRTHRQDDSTSPHVVPTYICSGADSYFALQELFGHPDLLIKPRDTQTPLPLDVTLGVDRRGIFKCRICAANLYGIYRLDDIEQLAATKDQELEALVLVDTVIVETIDFSTNMTSRHLSVRSPEPECADHAEIRELF